MLSFLLWMITDFENATTEVLRNKQPENNSGFDSWSRFSVALQIFLPVAGLAIFFKQKNIFSRLLLQLDKNCVSVFCPSLSRRQNLLKWAGDKLPQTWSSRSKTLSGGISDLWYDGSLLCTLINSVIPGACLNPHRHWKKPPLHAQAIAYKYLGVVPVFTESDLSEELTVTFERAFLQYLTELQQAVIKLSERTELNKIISAQYLARGMGLYTGEQFKKTVFYVYPQEGTKIRNNNSIIVHIRGPYGTYGEAVIPKFHNDLFTSSENEVVSKLLLTRKIINSNKPFIKTFSLPFINYHKKHMGDNIVIHIAMEDDRVKVTYIPKNYGMYEIIMVSNGELVRGCPFNVHILNNSSGNKETLESEEKEEAIPRTRKRKIISKTIDFVNEQLPVAELQRRNKNNESRHSNKKEEIELNPTAARSRETADEKSNKSTFKERKLSETNMEDTKNKGYSTKEARIEEDDENQLVLQPKMLSNDDIDSSKLNINTSLLDQRLSVVEKQNLESVSEDIEHKLQISNKNNSRNERAPNDSKHAEDKVIVVGDNVDESKDINNISVDSLVPTTHTINSILQGHDKDVINSQDVQDYTVYRARLSVNEYPKPIAVNKVQIPEKFQNIHKTDFINDLNSKYFKNVINNSNKKEIITELSSKVNTVDEDLKRQAKMINNPENKVNAEVNDSFIDNEKRRQIKQNLVLALSRKNSALDIQKINSIPRRFFEKDLSPSGSPKIQSPTSPICADHIVSEVNHDFKEMSVAEKRKIFAKQGPANMSGTTNSSFSEAENADVSKTHRHFQHIEGLSVMNFLNSLKQSENSRKPASLSSAKSLPNIPSIGGDYVFQNSVKERKSFWEKFSTSSSSLALNTEVSPKNKSKKLTEEERSRLIWMKVNEETTSHCNLNSEKEKFDLEKSSEMCRSADDIFSITNCVTCEGSKIYKSLDNSLDNCTMLSIEERKKMLLKQNYEKEMVERGRINTLKRQSSMNINSGVKTKETQFEERGVERNDDDTNKEAAVFSPILDKIRQYDKACNLTTSTKVEDAEIPSKENNIPKNDVTDQSCKELQSLSQPQKMTIKSHFKKAVNFFKNLEEKSFGTSNTIFSRQDSRRHSWDIQSKKSKSSKKGGSLNLPNVRDRFSISNLYEDISGSKKGSFKGAANRSALIESLATFFGEEDTNIKDDSEDNIKYDFFKKKAKRKNRRNIRSIFDLYY